MAMVKESSRPIVATWVRKQKVQRKRFYVRLSTALRRAVELLVTEGEPGDTIELAHNGLSFPIGTVTVHAAGQIAIDWTPLLNKAGVSAKVPT